MLRALVFVLSVVSIQASAVAGDGSFACFRELNKLNGSGNFLGKRDLFGINFRNDYGFDLLVDGKVQSCELPPHAESVHHAGPPFRVMVKIAGQKHYFTFEREGIHESAPQKNVKYSEAVCSFEDATYTKDAFKKGIELQLSEAREYCDSTILQSDNVTGGAQGRCYDHIHDALKVCEKAKNANLKVYAQEALKALAPRLAYPNQPMDGQPDPSAEH